MIYRVWSDLPTFRSVEFSSGMNVILADKTSRSSQKDSRNGLGKSTLIDIIHFCLGAGYRKGKGLLSEPLVGYTFFVALDISGQRYTVGRNTASPREILIEGPIDRLSIRFRRRPDGMAVVGIAEFCIALRRVVFGFDSAQENLEYSPTFRSLVPYFARRDKHAFSHPFEHFSKQKEWDKQVSNAFLLGLAWEDARDWQLIKDRKRLIDQLKKAAEGGLLKGIVGSRGELEAERVLIQAEAEKSAKGLAGFRVHDQYSEIEHRASEITKSIHGLANELHSKNSLLSLYKSGIENEAHPESTDVVDLYDAANASLPAMVVKRLEDVQAFHREIVRNRKSFLLEETIQLEREIKQIDAQMELLTLERSDLFLVLKSHGALEEYSHLQQRHLQRQDRLRRVTEKIENIQAIEDGGSTLRIEQEHLYRRASRDYDSCYEDRERAIRVFNENSQALYDTPGNLLIDIHEKTGFKFEIDIPRKDSHGISNMKVFCYDLMLAKIWSLRKSGPGFLLHDSALFDGVDDRQVARALEKAASESAISGFQYICTMNTDRVPKNEFSEGFYLSQYVRLILTDDSHDGGLLGIRF